MTHLTDRFVETCFPHQRIASGKVRNCLRDAGRDQD
jgi:hypothetical protein